MDARALRSAALGIIAIARQFGVRITADTIDSAIERGTLKNPNQLENALSALGMATQLRRINPKDLQNIETTSFSFLPFSFSICPFHFQSFVDCVHPCQQSMASPNGPSSIIAIAHPIQTKKKGAQVEISKGR